MSSGTTTPEKGSIPTKKKDNQDKRPPLRGKTLALLAHTEGYWYLIDEDEGDLLVVPDQTDKVIRLQLDEQPK